MRLKDWLLDLQENHYVELIDGEVCILPIKEDGEDDKQEEA